MKKLFFIILTISLHSCGLNKILLFEEKNQLISANEIFLTTKFENRNGHILIPISLDKKLPKCNMIFDTGAGLSVIDESYIDKINKKEKIFRIKDKGAYVLDSVLLFDQISVKRPMFLTLPLKQFKAIDSNFCGILGTNINSLFYTKLNYSDSSLTFSTKPIIFDTINYKKIQFHKKVASNDMKSIYSIGIKTKIAGFYFDDTTFDTGNNGLIYFYKTAADKVTIKDSTQIRKYISHDVADIYGKSNNQNLNIAYSDLFMGSVSMGKAKIILNNVRADSKEEKICIGYEVLKNADYYIDWKNQLIYFKQNISESPNTEFQAIEVKFKNTEYRVSSIIADCFWEKSGLNLDDKLLEVNGVLVQNYTKVELRKNLYEQNLYSIKFINSKNIITELKN